MRVDSSKSKVRLQDTPLDRRRSLRRRQRQLTISGVGLANVQPSVRAFMLHFRSALFLFSLLLAVILDPSPRTQTSNVPLRLSYLANAPAKHTASSFTFSKRSPRFLCSSARSPFWPSPPSSFPLEISQQVLSLPFLSAHFSLHSPPFFFVTPGAFSRNPPQPPRHLRRILHSS